MSRSNLTVKGLMASLLVAGGLVGSSCSVHTGRAVVYVPSAPPPVVRESMSVAPGAGYIWIPGHQAWDRGSYVWISGRWELAPHHSAHWIPGQWRQDRRGWYWVDGHWA